MIFPWQAKQWQQLNRLRTENRLPHALLFSGASGIGKGELAKDFAHLILCQTPTPDHQACGSCHSCHLTKAEAHPDFRHIKPEEEGQAIKIDQVRDLTDFVQQTSHQGGYRVVILEPAEAMNINAANALLKTLEEPSPETVLILVSDQRTTLPATIISRCQQYSFSLPAREESLAWLKAESPGVEWESILDAAQGSPFMALEWHQQGIWAFYQNFFRDLYALSQQEADPLHLAVQWKDTKLLWLFDMFFHWLVRLMRADSSMQVEQPSSYLLPGHISLLNLLEFSDYLQRLRREALGSYNLNQQLLLESLFIRWSQYAAR